MKTKFSVWDALSLFVLLYLTGWVLWVPRTKAGTRWFWIMIFTTFLLCGVLIGLDRYLRKRHSSESINRYYKGLAVLLGLATVTVLLIVLR